MNKEEWNYYMDILWLMYAKGFEKRVKFEVFGIVEENLKEKNEN